MGRVLILPNPLYSMPHAAYDGIGVRRKGVRKIGFLMHPKALFALRREAEGESGTEVIKRNWLSVTIWAVFAIWTLIAVLG